MPRPLSEGVGHLLGRLVVPAELVGQTGVGVRGRPAGRRPARGRRDARAAASGPSAQLSPTMNGSAWRMLCQKASTVWPDSVRPEASTIVPETITGRRSPISSKRSASAEIAAFALSVSKIVSMRRMSAPPSTRPGGQFAVGVFELRPRDAARRRVPTSGAHRRCPVRRAERAGDVARPVRLGCVRRRRRRSGRGGRPRHSARGPSPGRSRSPPGRSGSR